MDYQSGKRTIELYSPDTPSGFILAVDSGTSRLREIYDEAVPGSNKYDTQIHGLLCQGLCSYGVRGRWESDFNYGISGRWESDFKSQKEMKDFNDMAMGRKHEELRRSMVSLTEPRKYWKDNRGRLEHYF